MTTVQGQSVMVSVVASVTVMVLLGPTGILVGPEQTVVNFVTTSVAVT